MREEDKRGNFTKYVLSHEVLDSYAEEIKDFISEPYFMPNTKHEDFQKTKTTEKITADFQINVKQLHEGKTFTTDLLLFFLEKNDTTYICQDQHSYTMVNICFLPF